MRIETELVLTQNGYIKDGIEYNYLKTYEIYSDKGTFVGRASISATNSGLEDPSIVFRERYDSLIETISRHFERHLKH